MKNIRLALAQQNFTVGDIQGNVDKIIDTIEKAKQNQVDILAFPELCVTGYPPEDLLLKPAFLNQAYEAVKKIAKEVSDIVVIVGAPEVKDDVYNTAFILYDGEIAGTYHKIYLPNYGVFDENRYFQSGKDLTVLRMGAFKIGLNICEDMWYPKGPTYYQALYGDAELILNISASPYHLQKGRDRARMIQTRAEDNVVVIAYVNLVGGQDELVFDGNSLIVNEDGKTLCKGPAFEESLIISDIYRDHVFLRRLHDPRRRKAKLSLVTDTYNIQFVDIPVKEKKRTIFSSGIQEDFLPLEEEVLRALRTGLRDYVRKNGFSKVVIGLSGGIDSALVATIATQALGPENVVCVFMPSIYTSQISYEDARKLAKNLNVEYHEIPIDRIFDIYKKELKPFFKEREEDITEENLQARIRGNLLMAFSNKFGYLVLSTGNKSEVSVGYSTLYGDMVGGFSVIKDVPKTLVYRLANYINQNSGDEVIPQRIITRPPSAELKENQTDQDTLPPYDILDQIIQYYVEEDWSFDKIVEKGFEPETVKQVIRMVNANEYKRRQSAPGIKITPRSFGKDRRVPITNRFREYE
ncbi:MAG: NAD+ synthase [Methanobacteriota archaeon]|nr:MAG: NAD+ synthase [Euryarchaeota archaeon]